ILAIPDDERAERTRGGQLRVVNEVHWARRYLLWADLLDNGPRGRWQLSRAGWSLPLEDQDHSTALALFRRVRSERAEEWGQPQSDEDGDPDLPAAVDDSESAETTLSDSVRSTVLALSPGGFENLCKRLLTELGLMQLRTVGKAGDRGIDIEGHLRINSVV